MQLLKTFFSIKPKRQLKELYLFSVLFSFASSLILIFEPVFFYKEGLSLSAIALYYALHYTLYALLIPVGGKFVARFGAERSISLAMPLFVVYFLMLAVLPRMPQLLWIAWIVMTLYKILYWPAFHLQVSKFGAGENRGTELSWLFALTRGVGVLGPLIGGVVVTIFGFPTLFMLASGMAILAVFPLLRTKERMRITEFDYWAPWRVVMSRRHRGMRRAMMGWGEHLVDTVFWPIFMFIILGGSAQLLGYVATASMVLMALLGFFIGEISDRLPRRYVLRLHLPFVVLGYLLRPIASGTVGILLTDMLGKASFIGTRIPMWYRLYVQAKRVGPLKYMVAAEMVLAISKALTAWALVVVFAVMLPYAGFTTAFVLAAVLALLYIFL